MKILVSNDDGIAANGIRCLTEVLAREHEVYVVAPDRERSAAGHSLTLHTPLRVEEVEAYHGVKRAFVTTGTPGDCVKIGISAILSEEEQPDIVISGINHGPNLGADILYSGTVSCAMEGAMLGVPSIAMSLASMKCENEHFVNAANFINRILPMLKEYNFPKKSILNVNYPALADEDIAGIAITELGRKMFTDNYEKRVDPRGKVYYWMAGEFITATEEPHTDVAAIIENKISITPVTYEMTKEEVMPSLEAILCKEDYCNWLK
ncbi:MAG: 5'/3'-nucleotidase SurE [Candidatus Gastranaerophilales bacterium]